MEKIAYVFAGQGSQSIGMGSEFSNDPLFQQLSNHWSIPLTELFSETPYWVQHPFALQSMLATTSLVIASRVQEIIAPDIVAGLSLGEYSAFAFTNVIDLKNLWRILDQRSRWMEEIGQNNPSELVAVLGLAREQVSAVISSFKDIYIANHNAPEQIVIGGRLDVMDAIKQALLNAGARRCVTLPVVVASHTPLLNSMINLMMDLLEETITKTPSLPVVSNVTALPHDEHTWKTTLSNQLATTVEWVRSIEYMVQQGVTSFIEIGPGKVLSGLIQKIQPEVTTYNVNSLEDVLLLQAIKEKGGFQ